MLEEQKYVEESSIEFLGDVREHSKITIRRAELSDKDVLMEIYRKAQEYMVKSGNPNQWAVGHPN